MMDHPWHQHVNPAQVISISGGDSAYKTLMTTSPAWKDTVIVPAMGSIKLLVPVKDYAGATMFHCHILEHEDMEFQTSDCPRVNAETHHNLEKKDQGAAPHPSYGSSLDRHFGLTGQIKKRSIMDLGWAAEALGVAKRLPSVLYRSLSIHWRFDIKRWAMAPFPLQVRRATAWQKRGAILSMLSGIALSSLSPPAPAVSVFDGWTAAGGSTIDWSSDLGPDYVACFYSAGCNFSGTTTPANIPAGTSLAGQQITTQVSRRFPVGTLSSNQTVELQPNGNIEGQVTHFHIDNLAPAPYGVYGLGSNSNAGGSLRFSGLPAPASLIYWHVEWAIDVDAPGGADMSYGVQIEGNGPLVYNVAAADLSGSFSGGMQLPNGIGGVSSNGAGALAPNVFFGLNTPSVSNLPGTGGSLDVWVTFSALPITSLPVPVPAAFWLFGSSLAGLAGLGELAKRGQTHTS